jgi:Kelch motif
VDFYYVQTNVTCFLFLVNESALMVIGGWDGSAALPTVEVLDLAEGVWRSGPSLPAPSYGHACLNTQVAGRDGILVTGGALTGTGSSAKRYLAT